MSSHEFVTVDVFAEAPLEGNQLAVFPDATGIPEQAMLRIAKEFRLSETAFVLPAERGGTARVRIFTLDSEAAFAGHPLVGTAAVLGERLGLDELILEVPAGDCAISVATTQDGRRRARVVTPQPFAINGVVPRHLVAETLGVDPDAVLVATHAPTACGMGRPFVVAEVTRAALDGAVPDAHAFAAAREAIRSQRFAVLAYARDGEGTVSCRMFSPLTGTTEDAATGSANVALAGLLLHHDATRDSLALTSHQGVQMGRPSVLELDAHRTAEGIVAAVAGSVVPVMTGKLHLP